MLCWWKCFLRWKKYDCFMTVPQNRYDPAIPLLSLYSKELKTETPTIICTLRIMAVSFTIARWWKQPVSIDG